MHIILCLWLCWYVIYYTLHYIYPIYIQRPSYHILQSFHTFLNKYRRPLHIFPTSLCNILHIFLSSFMQSDAQWHDTLFDIRCTKLHLVASVFCILSHFVAFIFYTFLTQCFNPYPTLWNQNKNIKLKSHPFYHWTK